VRKVLLTAAAIAGSVAPVAGASEVKLATPIAERPHAAGGVTSYYGYVGPPTADWPARAGGWGTSSDTYICPGGQKNTGLVVVANDVISNDRAFTVISGKGKGSEFF